MHCFCHERERERERRICAKKKRQCTPALQSRAIYLSVQCIKRHAIKFSSFCACFFVIFILQISRTSAISVQQRGKRGRAGGDEGLINPAEPQSLKGFLFIFSQTYGYSISFRDEKYFYRRNTSFVPARVATTRIGYLRLSDSAVALLTSAACLKCKGKKKEKTRRRLKMFLEIATQAMRAQTHAPHTYIHVHASRAESFN